MSLKTPNTESSEQVEVQLLEPTLGSPIKNWPFKGESQISIGRGDDCMVQILDSHVSRLHAVLKIHGGEWLLISLGRNGVLVEGRTISEQPVSSGAKFQLGPLGPTMKFCSAAEPKPDYLQTLCFDPDAMPFFVLDESKLRNEVAEIESEDFFQKLQQKAQDLRRQREL